MRIISADLRELVIKRAKGKCEAEVTLLLNPRLQKWTEHFILAKSIIEGNIVTG